jgi:hypothetical protein
MTTDVGVYLDQNIWLKLGSTEDLKYKDKRSFKTQKMAIVSSYFKFRMVLSHLSESRFRMPSVVYVGNRDRFLSALLRKLETRNKCISISCVFLYAGCRHYKNSNTKLGGLKFVRFFNHDARFLGFHSNVNEN